MQHSYTVFCFSSASRVPTLTFRCVPMPRHTRFSHGPDGEGCGGGIGSALGQSTDLSGPKEDVRRRCLWALSSGIPGERGRGEDISLQGRLIDTNTVGSLSLSVYLVHFISVFNMSSA